MAPPRTRRKREVVESYLTMRGDEKHCVNHPRIKAAVWTQRGDAPGVDLCWDCFVRSLYLDGKVPSWYNVGKGKKAEAEEIDDTLSPVLV